MQTESSHLRKDLEIYSRETPSQKLSSVTIIYKDRESWGRMSSGSTSLLKKAHLDSGFSLPLSWVVSFLAAISTPLELRFWILQGKSREEANSGLHGAD